MLRITWAVSFLVTFIRFSHEIPVQNIDRLDVNFTEGIAITSPGYDNGHYPHLTEKYWELYAPHAKKIQVVFEDFDVEYHEDCIWDSVNLVGSKCEYLTESQNWDVVLCSPLPAYTFDFNGTSMCIMFTSDQYINRAGFKAHAIAIPDSTEDPSASTSPSSTIGISPATSTPQNNIFSSSTALDNLPQNPSSSASSQPAPPPPPPTPPQSSSSSSSSISSSPPPTPSSSSSSSQPPQPASSTTSLPSFPTESVSSSIHSSPLSWSSSNSAPSSASPSSASLSPISSPTPASSDKHSSEVKPTSETTILPSTTSASTPTMNVVMCEFTHTSIDIGNVHKIVVLSPKDETGEYYPRDKHCVLTLVSLQLQNIDIEFKQFSIESHPQCAYDYLELTTGEEPPYRLCGTTVPSPRSAHTKHLKLVFHSDQFFPLKGFEMELIKTSHTLITGSNSMNETTSHTGATESTSIVNNGSTPTTSTAEGTGSSVETTVVLDSASSTTNTPSSKGTESTKPYLPALSSSSQPTEAAIPSITTTQSPPTSSSLQSSTTTLTTTTVFTTLFSVLQSSQSSKASSTVVEAKGNEKTSTSVSKQSLPSTASTLHNIDYSSTVPLSDSIFSTKSQGSSPSSQSQSSVLMTETTISPSAKTEISTKGQTTSASTITSSATTSTTASSTTKAATATATIQSLDVVICEYPESSIDVIYLHKIDIQSPKDADDDTKYPLNKHCVLLLDNKQHLDIDISFPKFDIEYHPKCEWDYVLIKFGDEPSQTMCGSMSPNNLTTNAYKIEIVFHSDHMVALRGFKIQLSIKSSSSTDTPSSKGIESSSTKSTLPPLSSSSQTTETAMPSITTTQSPPTSSSLQSSTTTLTTTTVFTTLISKLQSSQSSKTTSTAAITVENEKTSVSKQPLSSSASTLQNIDYSSTVPLSDSIFSTTPQGSSPSSQSHSSVLTTETTIPPSAKTEISTNGQTTSATTIKSSAATSPTVSSTTKAATTALATIHSLDVVICEYNESSINMVYLHKMNIQSPKDDVDDKKYPLNKHCVLFLHNKQHLEIGISFPKFDIEYHPQCEWDYLLLKFGDEPSQNMCGSMSPNNLTTNANRIKIVFHSDYMVTLRGFKIQLSIKSSSSTETPSSKGTESSSTKSTLPALSSSSQTTEAAIPSVTTTQSPPTSSSLQSSTTTVTTTTEFTTLFSKLQSSQSSKTTSTAAITVENEKTSVSKQSLPSTTSTLQNINYSSTVPLSDSTFSTTSQSSSPSSQSQSSVLTTETAIPPSAKTEISTKGQTTSATTITPSATTSPTASSTTKAATTALATIHSLDVVICEYNESSINMLYLHKIDIQSPKDDVDDKKYPLNKHCVLFLDNKQHLNIDIAFLKFDVEYHPQCEWDYLLLKFGDEPSQTICGSMSPDNLTTNANRIEIVFHSDHMVTLRGFKMQLTIQSNPVADETQSMSHSTMPSTSQSSSASALSTPSTAAVTENDHSSTTFPSSSIAKESTTLSNVSVIKEDEVLMTPNYYSSTELTTAQNNVMTGVNETTQHETFKTPTEPTTTQESANKPGNAPSSSEHSLKSTTQGTKSSTSVGLTTKSSSEAFSETASDISPSLQQPTQSNAYLSTAENKQTTLSSLSQTNIFSTKMEPSTTVPTTVKTDESTLTGSSTTGLNTSLEHACSTEMMPAFMDEEFGYITSPGFGVSNEYPPERICRWIIKAEQNKVTMVIFKDFDVENSLGCILDSLVFYETSNSGETKQMLASLCGSNIPSTFSTNKNLLVEFKSDSMQQRAGFRFQYMKVQSDTGAIYSCPPGKIPCAINGTCIPVEWWCDGSIDCMDDQTDEMYCPKCLDDQIQCGDGVCLSASNRCDGISQCSYGTDELGCVSVSRGGIENSVQVNVQGDWFQLCYNNATVQIGDDICQAAGYRSVEVLSGEKVQDEQLFSVATWESGHLSFNKSSVCQGHKTVHLQCSDSGCGRKGEHVRKKRIIGGSVSSKGEWPWSVAVRVGNNVICGGSVIDSMWVVTAGHCVKDLVANPQILSIIAGVNDITDAERQIRYVSEVILHPKYDYIYNADIAILRLLQPLNFDNNTKSICLPWDKRQFSPSDLCYVTGYGVSDMKDFYTTVAPKFLRHVKTKIFDLDKCKNIYSTRYSNMDRIKDNMLCAGYTSSGMDACKGDSGGGLMCKTADDRWLLAGVVSWGDMCGNTNRPGVYTDVESFMDWIANTTNPNGVENVTCDFERNGWCGYTDNSTDSYVWTRKPGDKYVKGTILYATRTSTSNNEPANASLLTPSFNIQGEGCLTFSFMFSGNSNITLSVFGVDDSDVQEPRSDLLWRVTSHYPAKDSWKSTEVALPIACSRLKFVSLSEHGGIVGLALDNISVTTGQCLGSEFMSCTFNDGNICSYDQYQGVHSKPWTVLPEVTAAAVQGTQDFYIKAGGDFKTFGYLAMSQFVSPLLSRVFTSIPHCVTFSFNKRTHTANDLVLATYVTIWTQLTNQKVFWSSVDAEVGQWTSVSTTIHHGIYDHIVFEVQRKHYTYENIEMLLDDIRVSDGVCVN